MTISRKELIARSSRFFAKKTAVIFGNQRLTFSEVNERASRLANALIGLGLLPRDRIATLMSNCLQYPEIEFALVKGSFPQITLNPRITPKELLHQLVETEAQGIIVDKQYAASIRTVLSQLKKMKVVICVNGKEAEMQDYERLLQSANAAEPYDELTGEDIGEIRYTSGTTGGPKGVLLPYKSRLAITRNLLMDQMGDFTSQDKFLALQPLYHGAGWFILPVWVRGGAHYIVPNYEPQQSLELIQQEGITVIKTIPTVLLRLLNSQELKKYKLNTLRTIIYGGSPMPVEKLKEAIEHFGPIFINLYGQLEAAMTITTLRKEEHYGSRLGSVGRPCTLVDVRVVNEDGEDIQANEIGEIIVKGDHQMIGYLNRSDATSQTLRSGWIYTGDLGTVDQEGYIYLTGGRKSEMIISGGLNIYPSEIEQVIYQHPAVVEVAVIGVPHPEWVEAVKACVVLKKEFQVSENELLDFCKERLAGFKKPKSIDFFDRLPHNASGKIDYPELKRKYSNQVGG